MPIARSLRAQSLLLFGGSLLSMLVIALAGFSLLAHELTRYQALLDGPQAYIRQIDAAQLTFKLQVQDWKNLLLRGHDPVQGDTYWQAFLAREADVQRQLGELESSADVDLRPQIAALRKEHLQLGERYRLARQAYLTSGYDARQGDAQVKGIDRATAQRLTELVEQSHARIQALTRAIHAESHREILLGGLALLVCGGLLLVLGLRLVERRLADPLVACAEQLGRLSRGRFGERLPVQRQDELGQLTHNLNLLREAAIRHSQGARHQAAELAALGTALERLSLTEPGQAPAAIKPQQLRELSRRLQDVASELQEFAQERSD